MEIAQAPENGKTYFQNNIPNFVLQKTGTENSISFRLFVSNADSDSIVENYFFDSDGRITIRDASSFISNYLENIVEVPATGIIFSTNNHRQVKWQITGGSINQSGSFYVLKCKHDMVGIDAENWIQEKFLTTLQSGKRTTERRNEILSFLQMAQMGVLNVKFNINYIRNGNLLSSTGNLLTVSTHTPTGNASAYRTVSFNTSLRNVRAKAPVLSTDKILTYQIWIEHATGRTRRYTYFNDFSPYRHETHFVFSNTFGVMETFTATGKTESPRTADFAFGNIENNYRRVSQDFVIENTVFSGYLSPDEMQWIDEIAKSHALARYEPGAGVREEITLTGISKTDTNANELQAFTFTYRRAKNLHFVIVDTDSQRIFDFTYDYTYE